MKYTSWTEAISKCTFYAKFAQKGGLDKHSEAVHIWKKNLFC